MKAKRLASLVCLLIMVLTVAPVAVYASDNVPINIKVIRRDDGFYVDLADVDAMTAISRMMAYTYEPPDSNGEFKAFVFLAPIKGCIYFEIPVAVFGTEENENYTKIKWQCWFYDVEKDDAFCANEYLYADGRYVSAILDLRKENTPITVDGFFVWPDIENSSSGSCDIAFLPQAIIGFASESDANQFIQSLKSKQFGAKPSSADLDAINADIKYPLKESYYLDEYRYGTVAINGVMAFLNPNASDVTTKGNSFLVYKGEEAIIIAESSTYVCAIFPGLGRAGWINRGYLTIDSSQHVFTEQGFRPSTADLDAIHAECRYPRKDSYYLDDYIYTKTKTRCQAYLDPNLGDVRVTGNYFEVKIDEQVVILAESGNYACAVFPDLGRAGWINREYLENS